MNHRVICHVLPILLALAAISMVFQYGEDAHDSRGISVSAAGGVTPPTGQVSRVQGNQLEGNAHASRIQTIGSGKGTSAAVARILESYRSGNHSVSETSVVGMLDKVVGDQVAMDFNSFQLEGTVIAKDRTDGITQIAVELRDGMGRFQLCHRMDSRVLAALFFTNEEVAFRFGGKPADGGWQLELSSVSQILCAKPGTTYPFHGQALAMPLSPKSAKAESAADASAGADSAVIPLSSNPDSTFVLYMDFDGEKLSHPWWTGAEIIDVEPHERAGDDRFVTRVWRRVVEDFAAFDINVTTDRAVYDMAAIERRVLVIITPTNLVAPGAGGVAYLNTFGMNVPCWGFNPDEGSCADTISHEVGHTLGLIHDGKVGVNEYYGGHGTGKTSWAPIMGAYFADPLPPYVDDEVTSWSKGEYPGATNQEDDLAIITTSNGFSYRKDDHGNNADAASDLFIESGRVMDQGLITKTGDTDWFQFSTSGGNVYFHAKALDIHSPDHDPGGANLALDLAIVDRFGDVLASNTDPEVLDAECGALLRSGVYFLRVKGAGRGTLANSFGKYASLGQYSLGGWVPQVGVVRVIPGETELSYEAQSSSFTVVESGEWTWSSDAEWLVVDAPAKWKGSRELEYRVTRNPSKEPRTAAVTIQSGRHIARMHVTQSGIVGYDDHADVFSDATEVAQNSTTEGILEVSGDADVFRIQVIESGYLNIRTTGDTDTIGTLSDAAGNVLASNDNRHAPNFGIQHLVMDGAYYVTVRHGSGGSGGKYSLNCTLETASVFKLEDRETFVGPSGGNYTIAIQADGDWAWRSNVSWITSSMDSSQSDGGLLGFKVAPYSGSGSRRGTITIYNGAQSITHTVIQQPSGADDHSDSVVRATLLPIGRTVRGYINYEGDVDIFKVSTNKSGLLLVDSLLNTDVKGRLLDARGNELARNDDFENANFGIRHQVSAGDYYVEVSHSDPEATGGYQLSVDLQHSILVDLSYQAGYGGWIRGSKKQTVEFKGDARPVMAVAQEGYRFLRWSDGVTTQRRADTRLLSHMSVKAFFEPCLKLSAVGIGRMKESAGYNLDFGPLRSGRAVSKTVRIRNSGSRAMSDFHVSPFRSNHDTRWTLKGLEGVTLAPGQVVEVRITCLPGETEGNLAAECRISAQGLAKSLILRAEARVFSGADKRLSSVQGKDSHPSRSAMAPADLPMGLEQGLWIEVSQDGYFRYRFHRPKDEDSEPEFQISTNGSDWEEALVLDVWKVETTQESIYFEAIIAPPSVPVPRILVSESTPIPSDRR